MTNPTANMTSEEFNQALKGYLQRIKSQNGAIVNLQQEIKDLKKLLFGVEDYRITKNVEGTIEIQAVGGGPTIKLSKRSDMGLLGTTRDVWSVMD